MESFTWGVIVAVVATAATLWFLGVVFLVALLLGVEALGKWWKQVVFLLVGVTFLFLWLVLGFTGVHWLGVAAGVIR